jgi:WD40 repeat protein
MSFKDGAVAEAAARCFGKTDQIGGQPLHERSGTATGCFSASQMTQRSAAYPPATPIVVHDQTGSMKGTNGPVSDVAFSPDGRFVAGVHHLLVAPGAMIAKDVNVRLWDAKSGAEIWATGTLPGTAVAFSPDGHLLAVAAEIFGIEFLDALTGEKKFVLRPDDDVPEMNMPTHVWSVAFCPDSHLLVNGASNGKLQLWDTRTQKCIKRLVCRRGGTATCVTFSNDGRYIASGHRSGQLSVGLRPDSASAFLWSVEKDEPLAAFRGHDGDVTSVALSQDARSLLTASADGIVRLWDTETHKEIRRFTGQSRSLMMRDEVRKAAFSPDNALIATASKDSTVRLWDVATGQELVRYVGHSDAVLGIAFSPDGKNLVSGSLDGTARVWEVL